MGFKFRIALLFFALSTLPFLGFAQKAAFRLGKVEPEDFQVKPEWESAPAVVLGDLGMLHFKIDGNNYMTTEFTRRQRILLLQGAGLEYANFSVYYQDHDNYQSVNKIKGYVHILRNGKVHSEKFNGKDVLEKRVNKYHKEIKAALPGAQLGAIVEFEFTRHTQGIYELPEWHFQRGIPTAWSELRMRIPDFYEYQMVYQGYEKFFIQEVENESEEYRFTVAGSQTDISSTGLQGGGALPTSRTYNITSVSKNYRWVLKDAPAIEPERYMGTTLDHINRIRFQLSAEKDFNTNAMKPVYFSWDKIAEKLDRSVRFGQMLRRNDFHPKLPSLSGKSDAEKAIFVCDFLKSKLHWDGYHSVYATARPQKFIDSGKGNVASLNLTLVGMLRELGLEAYPVALSTRSNGRINALYPLEDQLNYLIAEVVLPEGSMLLDVASPHVPTGKLPEKALNGSGWRVQRGNPVWIPLETRSAHSEAVTAQLTLDENGQLKGKVNVLYKNYAAYSMRKSLVGLSEEKLEEFVSGNKEDDFTLEGKNPVVEGLKDPTAPLKISYDATYTLSEETQVGDAIYLLPLLEFGTTEMPYKNENRKFPIELPFLLKDKFVAQIQLPEGYALAETPEPVQVNLPDGIGSFRFIVQPRGNVIQVIHQFELNKKVFAPGEYPFLKAFYAHMLKAHKTPLVIQKKS